MRYSDELIDEIRERNDIVDVVGQYVQLQRKGSSYFGLCPFHHEKTGSFSVSPGKQIFYCFGCHEGGNVITFVQKYENYTYMEAIKYLAERAGVQLPEIEMSKEAKERENRRNRLLEANREAAVYFVHQLKTKSGEEGMKYLKGRGLTDETIANFGLGFANITSDDCYKYLKYKGFSDEIIRDSGLASFNEKFGMQDKFWNRVMFPIMDINNHVIGFGGRVMSDATPKYLNSQETDIFNKRRNLYGLNVARRNRKNRFILCEGYMDVISQHQAGFTEAVASLGTAFTSEQALLLHRYTDTVLLAYDSDGAGVNAAIRALEILRNAGMSGKIINLKPYKDPDEFIKNLGAEEYEKRLESAENGFMFEIRMLQTGYDMNDPDSKTRFIKEVANRLMNFEDEIERDNYITAVAAGFDIFVDALRKQVVNVASRTGGAAVRPIERPKSGINSKDPSDHIKRNQRILLTWLCETPDIYKQVKEFVKPEDFTDELYQTVAKKLYENLEEGRTNPSAIVSYFEDEDQQSEVAKIFNTGLEIQGGIAEREKALRDVVLSVKRSSSEALNTKDSPTTEDIMKMLEDKKALSKLANISFHLKE